jgi:RAD50-interacting protein 1
LQYDPGRYVTYFSQFFVDLWDELQRRAKKTDLDDNLAGPISHADVKSSTSASVGSDEDGALFDETIIAFKKRRDHAEGLIVEALKYGFPSTLRPYFNKPQWLTVDDDSESGKSCN